MTDTDDLQAAKEGVDPAQKYIRTFAGDMAVAQKGGKPDLAPYEEHKKLLSETPPVSPVASEPVSAPAPIAPPPPVPAPVPTAPPVPTWDEHVRDETLARLHAQMERDAAQGVRRSTERSEAIGLSEGAQAAPSPLHTYSEDFSDRVTDQQASTVSVLAAEQDAGPHRVGVVEESPTRKLVYATVGVLLLAVGSAGAYFAYSQYLTKQAPVVMPVVATAPIFVDEREEVVGEGATLAQAMQSSITRPLAPDTVRFLYSANATTTRDSLFVTAAIAAPNIVLRNIVGEGSMAGVINNGGAQSPFFILVVASYNETFAGMLSWERTMPRDLGAFFPAFTPTVTVLPPATTTASTTGAGAAASTTTVATPPARPVIIPAFTDETLANQDVRVYKDAEGRVVLVYGYWNPQTLVIARSRTAYTEIVGRLANSR